MSGVTININNSNAKNPIPRSDRNAPTPCSQPPCLPHCQAVQTAHVGRKPSAWKETHEFNEALVNVFLPRHGDKFTVTMDPAFVRQWAAEHNIDTDKAALKIKAKTQKWLLCAMCPEIIVWSSVQKPKRHLKGFPKHKALYQSYCREYAARVEPVAVPTTAPCVVGLPWMPALELPCAVKVEHQDEAAADPNDDVIMLDVDSPHMKTERVVNKENVAQLAEQTVIIISDDDDVGAGMQDAQFNDMRSKYRMYLQGLKVPHTKRIDCPPLLPVDVAQNAIKTKAQTESQSSGPSLPAYETPNGTVLSTVHRVKKYLKEVMPHGDDVEGLIAKDQKAKNRKKKLRKSVWGDLNDLVHLNVCTKGCHKFVGDSKCDDGLCPECVQNATATQRKAPRRRPRRRQQNRKEENDS
mmetsp:Transcript_37710/g.61997  ORF Transcript_37710/g.61997 Transcript_37710/m.61997 type:complete len:409 (+) Transcript_37710:47-1273(+)